MPRDFESGDKYGVAARRFTLSGKIILPARRYSTASEIGLQAYPYGLFTSDNLIFNALSSSAVTAFSEFERSVNSSGSASIS